MVVELLAPHGTMGGGKGGGRRGASRFTDSLVNPRRPQLSANAIRSAFACAASVTPYDASDARYLIATEREGSWATCPRASWWDARANLGFATTSRTKGIHDAQRGSACTRRPILFSRSIEPIVSVHARIHGGGSARGGRKGCCSAKRYAPLHPSTRLLDQSGHEFEFLTCESYRGVSM